MEVAGHEITVAKAKTKLAAAVAKTETVNRGKVTNVAVHEKNMNFFYMIKTYENGDTLVKLYPKNIVSEKEWVLLN